MLNRCRCVPIGSSLDISGLYIALVVVDNCLLGLAPLLAPVNLNRVNSISNSRKFRPSSDYVEDVELYRPGGYHLVHLGDTLSDGRYRIIHKLGFGGFSTVWLA